MFRISILKCRKSIARLMIVLGLAMGGGDNAYSQTNNASGMVNAKLDEAATRRDPFWPIEYAPVANIKKESGQEEITPALSTNWSEAMKKVAINGVSSRADDEFFAVINGRVKRVGETITLEYEGIIYTWAVDSITPPGSVKLRRVSVK